MRTLSYDRSMHQELPSSEQLAPKDSGDDSLQKRQDPIPGRQPESQDQDVETRKGHDLGALFSPDESAQVAEALHRRQLWKPTLDMPSREHAAELEERKMWLGTALGGPKGELNDESRSSQKVIAQAMRDTIREAQDSPALADRYRDAKTYSRAQTMINELDEGKTSLRQILNSVHIKKEDFGAIKMLSLSLLEQYRKNGVQESWERLSEKQKRIVRLGELIGHEIERRHIAYSLVNKPRQMDPDVAQRAYRRYAKYSKSADIPDDLKRDFENIADRLADTYQLDCLPDLKATPSLPIASVETYVKGTHEEQEAGEPLIAPETIHDVVLVPEESQVMEWRAVFTKTLGKAVRAPWGWFQRYRNAHREHRARKEAAQQPQADVKQSETARDGSEDSSIVANQMEPAEQLDTQSLPEDKSEESYLVRDIIKWQQDNQKGGYGQWRLDQSVRDEQRSLLEHVAELVEIDPEIFWESLRESTDGSEKHEREGTPVVPPIIDSEQLRNSEGTEESEKSNIIDDIILWNQAHPKGRYKEWLNGINNEQRENFNIAYNLSRKEDQSPKAFWKSLRKHTDSVDAEKAA